MPLRQIEFAKEHLKLVQTFDCGDPYYSNWIGDPFNGPLQSIEKRKNTVWIYQLDEFVVGYASLGLIRWPIPPPDGPKVHVGYIPMFAVAGAFQGKPDSGESYSTLMLNSVVEEARAREYSTLYLMVHEDNARAIRCYERNGFVNTGWTQETKVGTHIKMMMDL